MNKSTPIEDHLAIALDTSDIEQALDWANSVKGVFGIAKVGLELYSSSGPLVIDSLIQMGFKVFLDLKFHDIPVTVEKASTVVGRFGISYLTIHAAGGKKMIEAALTGLDRGSSEGGFQAPMLLGVTVLTSDESAPSSILEDRAYALRDAGARGLVCATSDLAYLSKLVPEFTRVVPGIRRKSDAVGDQVRVADPRSALLAGADILVIGRPITSSDDPKREAKSIRQSVEDIVN